MRSKIDIMYQSDNNYAMLTGVSLVSLFENNKDIDEILVHILNDNISENNLKKLKATCDKYNRKLHIVDIKKIIEQLKELKVAQYKGKYTTFLRIMSINLLQPISNRILSIDGDTIINSSIKELCNINMNDYLCAGVCDTILNSYKKYVNIPYNDKYYNGGVLLFNYENWIKNDCEGKIIKFLKNEKNKFYLGDQDIFNSLFRKEFLRLDIKYNFNSGFYIYGINESFKLYDFEPQFYYTKDEVQRAYDNPVIYHCMGTLTGRPWEKNNTHPQKEIFNKYKNMSLWKNEPEREANSNKLFKIQQILYKILPVFLYIPIHKTILKRYLKKMDKNAKNS